MSSPRRLERLIVFTSLFLCPAARSATLPFSGELSLELHGPESIVLFSQQASGAVDVSASGVHLTGANLGAGAFPATPLLRNVYTAFSFGLAEISLDASNGAGVFEESAGGAVGGTMPLQGILKICAFGACSTSPNSIIPLSIIGAGGSAFAEGGLEMTVRGAPWTTGTVQVGALSAHGSARGPASLASSTAQLGGSLNLVSPVFISSNIGVAQVIPSFARLRLNLGGTADCANGVDDDGDGLADFPADPGCVNADDLSEQQADVACDDGIDNDGDGHVDFPADPGCSDPSGLDEHACSEDLISGPVTIPGPPTAPGFRDFGANTLISGVSANGSVVTGGVDCGAFRWTEPDGLDWLGALGIGGLGTDVSADGTTIVGYGENQQGNYEAFRWTLEGGMVGLGTSVNGGFPTIPNAVSADGSVIVGDVWRPDLDRYEAFRWTRDLGIVALGYLPGDDVNYVGGVSGDGSIIVGASGNSAELSTQAFVWTEAGGMIGLGGLGHTTTVNSRAAAISLDGGTVVGSAESVPFRWSPAEGMIELPLPSGDSGLAFATTADGSVILGEGHGSSTQKNYLWDRHGHRSLFVDTQNPSGPNTVLTAAGFDLSQWYNLRVEGLSADGLTFFGSGDQISGPGHAWVAVIAGCLDGVDDDGDGRIDFPNDPGCSAATDLYERGDGFVCDNGVDDDGDGAADYPADRGCSSPSDTTEEFGTTICDDGIDNDGDTLTDFPADPGCASLLDDDETSPAFACGNGLDDDGDGLVDFPADPGCASAVDASERSAALICDDGVDNDGDGFIDFPADPNCVSPSDPTEVSQCSNGIDDDRDGAVDYPQDLGCASASSDREYAMCEDGIDNQGDGTIDFDGGASRNGGIPLAPADPRCIHPYDNRETPSCGLGVELVLVLGALLRWQRRARRI